MQLQTAFCSSNQQLLVNLLLLIRVMWKGSLMPIRVAVVDNHPLFRDAVVSVVDASPEFEVIAQGECGSDAVRIARQQQPDIMLLDVNMSDSGIDAAREITAICPSVKTVMLTSCDESESGAAARAAGAHNSIVKGLSAAELMATLRAVYRGT
jgi:two-component system, NarL family, nitrate/nitrite response regulator NarL